MRLRFSMPARKPRKKPSGMLVAQRMTSKCRLSSKTSLSGKPLVVKDPIIGKKEINVTKTNDAAMSIKTPLKELTINVLKFFIYPIPMSGSAGKHKSMYAVNDTDNAKHNHYKKEGLFQAILFYNQ